MFLLLLMNLAFAGNCGKVYGIKDSEGFCKVSFEQLPGYSEMVLSSSCQWDCDALELVNGKLEMNSDKRRAKIEAFQIKDNIEMRLQALEEKTKDKNK